MYRSVHVTTFLNYVLQLSILSNKHIKLSKQNVPSPKIFYKAICIDILDNIITHLYLRRALLLIIEVLVLPVTYSKTGPLIVCWLCAKRMNCIT